MSAASPKKKTVRKVAKPSVHPPVAEMVATAIKTLKERGGSSLAAIKKYISANYRGIDMVRLAPFVRRFLRKACVAGVLVQTKGTGASGSFRLGAAAKKPKAKKPKAKKLKAKKAKKPKAKKAKKPKAKKAKKPKAKKAKKPKAKKAKKPAAKKPKKPAAKKPKKPAAKKAAKKPAAKKAAK